MDVAITVIVSTVYTILAILWFLLFVEAILSWIESARTHPIYKFIQAITGPVVSPIRLLLQKFEFFRNLPIDLSHLFTIVIIGALMTIVEIWL